MLPTCHSPPGSMVSLKVLHVYIQSPLFPSPVPSMVSLKVLRVHPICPPPSPLSHSLSLGRRKKKSPKMFTWNHELLEQILMLLKDVAIQTPRPVHPILWISQTSPSPATPTRRHSCPPPYPPSLLRNSLTLHWFSLSQWLDDKHQFRHSNFPISLYQD